MKKKLLLIAGALIVFGGLLFAAAMQTTGWNFVALLQPETTQTVITQPFSDVEILAGAEDVVLAKSEDGVCKVVFTERHAGEHSAAVKDGKLRIQRQKKSLFSLFSVQETVLYLPQAQYGALAVQSNTGSVSLPRDFTFESITVTTDTGEIRCNASAKDGLTLTTDTGAIFAEDCAAKVLSVFVSTGRTSVMRAECEEFISRGDTGDLEMDDVFAAQMIAVTRDTGDVHMRACDAGELEIKTDTGDVTGSLLSEKVFICRTDTGRITVPETIHGGKCKITTDTGDIRLVIKN